MQSTGAYKKAPLGGRGGGNSFQRQLRSNGVCKDSQKAVIGKISRREEVITTINSNYLAIACGTVAFKDVTYNSGSSRRMSDDDTYGILPTNRAVIHLDGGVGNQGSGLIENDTCTVFRVRAAVSHIHRQARSSQNPLGIDQSDLAGITGKLNSATDNAEDGIGIILNANVTRISLHLNYHVLKGMGARSRNLHAGNTSTTASTIDFHTG